MRLYIQGQTKPDFTPEIAPALAGDVFISGVSTATGLIASWAIIRYGLDIPQTIKNASEYLPTAGLMIGSLSIPAAASVSWLGGKIEERAHSSNLHIQDRC